MHTTQVLLATVFAASAVFAAPTPASSNDPSLSTDSASASTEWSIEGLHRDCTDDNSSCHWLFDIVDGASGEDCSYYTAGPFANGGPTTCGDYTVTSNYVGDADPAWTQFSIVKDGLIIYPSYTDEVLANPPVADWASAPQPTP